MLVTADEDERKKFKSLVRKWKEAKTLDKGKKISKTIVDQFPLAENWVAWWRKRQHLIMPAAIAEAKPESMLPYQPTTNNNIESYHRTFKSVTRRRNMPIYMAVGQALFFVSEIMMATNAMQDGYRLPNRDRHKKRPNLKLSKQEWH